MYISDFDGWFGLAKQWSEEWWDRYEVVEKPDWKKKEIENKIASLQDTIKYCEKRSIDYLRVKADREIELKKLEEELAQLK